MITDDLVGLSSTLFAQAGIAGGPTGIFPLPPGGNNRVVRVEAATGESFLLKTYWAGSGDERDRLGTEWKFSSFLWERGVRCIAEPVACDPSQGASLYRFIHGGPVAAAVIGTDHLRAAGEFIHRINRWRAEARETRLGSASEACFSLNEHLECIERRIHHLQNIVVGTALEREAELFVNGHLLPAWRHIRDKVVSGSTVAPEMLAVTLSGEERCISPSDFGFHNALLDACGSICWLDFEYAGFDDPAKLVCDFFCQPKVPVDPINWNLFLDACRWSEKERLGIKARARLLFPVYQIKWCCILLNEFLPAGAARRRFARDGNCGTDVRPRQLAKARAALNGCLAEDICHGLH